MYAHQLCLSLFVSLFLPCRAVPAVRPGAGGCSLSFPWRIEPSSPSCPWPPSRSDSLPSAGSSSLSHARGHGDGWADRPDAWASMQFKNSFGHSLVIYSFIHVLKSQSFLLGMKEGRLCLYDGIPFPLSICSSFNQQPNWLYWATKHFKGLTSHLVMFRVKVVLLSPVTSI